MNVDTVHTRTLRRALDALGSVEKLAAELGASVMEVEAWLAGLEEADEQRHPRRSAP